MKIEDSTNTVGNRQKRNEVKQEPAGADSKTPKVGSLGLSAEISRKDFLKRAGMASAALTTVALGGIRVANAAPYFAGNTNVAQGWSPDDPLMPTGDSDLDTYDIQNAIHDPHLDSGGTLYLGPGEFLINASLVRQMFTSSQFGYNPTPFNGTIRGSGKGVTIIRSVRHPNGDEFTKIYDALFDVYYGCTLWITDHDYLAIKDLTFDADSGIAEPWTLWGYRLATGNLVYVTAGSNFEWQGTPFGSDFMNVHFKGPRNGSGLAEMPGLFVFWGGGGGTHNMKSCDFDSCFDYAAWYYGLGDSTLNIGGKPNEKVTFRNAGEPGASINLNAFSNTVANVSRNDVNDIGIVVYGEGPEPSTMNITHNEITQSPGSSYAGLELWGLANSNAFVSNNNIHRDGLLGALYTHSTSNAVITNNKLSGATGYGGLALNQCEECMLLGNDLQQASASITAPITLLNCSRCTVVGHARGNAAVLPELGDNILVGVNNMGQNIGREISEAMSARSDAKRAMLEQRAVRRRSIP